MPEDLHHCSHDGCQATIKRNQWARTKAHQSGWFFQKDGAMWCPEHTPEWVAEWRAKAGRTKGWK